MPNIIINTCSRTSNHDAIQAVSAFMLYNWNSKPSYSYDRDVSVKSGAIIRVSEKKPENNELSCDCSFQVTNVKKGNWRIF